MNSHKLRGVFLLAIIALIGGVLYLWNPDRTVIEEKPPPVPEIQEEVSRIAEETVPLDVGPEAEVEAEQADDEANFRVRVGPEEFPVLFEDGDYENLDKESLIWTVNNLFEHVFAFEIIESGSPRKYRVNSHEVKTNLYLNVLSKGAYGPVIFSYNYGIIDYKDMVEEDGIYHIVLSQGFVEAFIEASNFAEVTDELNEFIERLNRIQSEELGSLTETKMDTMLYIDPRISDNPSIDEKRLGLGEFLLSAYYLPSNVFWIEESEELTRYVAGDKGDSIIFGQAIYYNREDYLRSISYLREGIVPNVAAPSNFDARLHTEPDASPFVWVAAGLKGFIYHDRRWKIAIFKPGT